MGIRDIVYFELEPIGYSEEDIQACYVIGVVSKMLDIHPQTLRNYERMGLVVPERTDGNTRLYSKVDIERIARIQRLTQELGVNLAGAEVILHMQDRMDQVKKEMQEEMDRMRQEIRRLRELLGNTVEVEVEGDEPGDRRVPGRRRPDALREEPRAQPGAGH